MMGVAASWHGSIAILYCLPADFCQQQQALAPVMHYSPPICWSLHRDPFRPCPHRNSHHFLPIEQSIQPSTDITHLQDTTLPLILFKFHRRAPLPVDTQFESKLEKLMTRRPQPIWSKCFADRLPDIMYSSLWGGEIIYHHHTDMLLFSPFSFQSKLPWHIQHQFGRGNPLFLLFCSCLLRLLGAFAPILQKPSSFFPATHSWVDYMVVCVCVVGRSLSSSCAIRYKCFFVISLQSGVFGMGLGNREEGPSHNLSSTLH